jgi:Carboxypeptidase regulatory-like domain
MLLDPTVLLFAMLAQSQATTSMPVAPRDNPPLAKGTASIKGKVVAAPGGRALRRVQISLSSPDLGEAKSVSTNSQGLFEFTELPAGRYTLTASRAGYLRTYYGQRRYGETGRPIELADGQRFVDADFSLPRTGAIIGRVTDEVGDPMPNASVYPMQWKYFRGQRRLTPVAGGGPFNRTDDTGQYRITGLEPGEYMVMAVTRDSWTDDKNPKERIGFLPTYAAGSASPADAIPVKVGLGQEVVVPEFPMGRYPARHVRWPAAQRHRDPSLEIDAQSPRHAARRYRGADGRQRDSLP